MAERLVAQYGLEVAQRLADSLWRVSAEFPREAFLAHCRPGFDTLGLMARGQRLTEALALTLPADFSAAADWLEASLGSPLADARSFGMSSFFYLPHSLYASHCGLAQPARALALLHAVTQRFTGEFALRAFVRQHPALTWSTLADWCDDPSEHVRRLVSEGTRPRLPWAARLPELQRDPAPVLPLLTRLRDDPSAYVRRSVANHLNDLGKDHPRLLLSLCRDWLVQASPARQALIRHALRSRIKAGDAEALALLGYAGSDALVVTDIWQQPAAPQLGDTLQCGLTLVNRGVTAKAVCLDLVVYFAAAPGSGTVRRKVFKWHTGTLAAGAAAVLRQRVSLREMSTRRLYPGAHRLAVLINGEERPLDAFVLSPRSAPADTD